MNADPPPPHEGLQLFARYAYPPNERGYCGPAEHRALLASATSGVTHPRLAELARGFTGPRPYLELLAEAAGADDPFAWRVVEAYWVGNELLELVVADDFDRRLHEAFAHQAGAQWGFLAEAVPDGAACHHSFHVLGVYPWTRLLGTRASEQALHVLEQCRIRWGRVVAVDGARVTVESRPLTWDGRRLALGTRRREHAAWARDGHGFVDDLQPGESVALHWDWVCDRLSEAQRTSLRHHTLRHLELTNARIARAAAAHA